MHDHNTSRAALSFREFHQVQIDKLGYSDSSKDNKYVARTSDRATYQSLSCTFISLAYRGSSKHNPVVNQLGGGKMSPAYNPASLII